MKVLVCGGRDYSDKVTVWNTLSDFDRKNPIELLIHGACKHWDNDNRCWIGADRFASEWARAFRTPQLPFPADWKRFGKAAGPMRNQDMLVTGCPDIVLAFQGGRGTADMVRRAELREVAVVRIDWR